MRNSLQIIGGMLLLMAGVVTAQPLDLANVEQAAIRRASELQQLGAEGEALSQKAVAAGQLPDPKVVLGTMNVPTDTFDFNQEGMTQIQVGITQAFPRGRTRAYLSKQRQEMAQTKFEQKALMRADILRTVRLGWLDLYDALARRYLVRLQKEVFIQQEKVTESLLSNGKAQQKDLIRAQLEVANLDNRLIGLNQAVAKARIHLARWVGGSLAKRVLPNHIPAWKRPPPLAQLDEVIQKHVSLKVDQAKIATQRVGVHLARQGYWPGVSVGAMYGFRHGYDLDGSHRANFLSAQMSFDLPVFTKNRQDRQYKASEAELLAVEKNQLTHYRALRERLAVAYATWREFTQSSDLYRTRLIPAAKNYAEATLVAYQNDQTDFPTLARGYMSELETKLAALKANVELSKARVDLLYLQGK